MTLFDKRCFTKRDDYDPVPNSEDQPLIVGKDEKARRKRIRRRICLWLFAAVAFIFVGHGVFAYMYTRSHVKCVPYEPDGGKTVVELPIYRRGSAVLLHSSVNSGDVLVTHTKKGNNMVTITLQEESKTVDENAEIRLCVLEGGKITGVGIFANKKDQSSLPFIKNAVVEVPVEIPQPTIDLLAPPKRHCSITGFLKWVGVWNSKGTNAAKLEAEGYN